MNKHLKCFLKLLGTPLVICSGIVLTLIQMPLFLLGVAISISGCFTFDDIPDKYTEPAILVLCGWYSDL